jgi:hypothetical protein
VDSINRPKQKIYQSQKKLPRHHDAAISHKKISNLIYLSNISQNLKYYQSEERHWGVSASAESEDKSLMPFVFSFAKLRKNVSFHFFICIKNFSTYPKLEHLYHFADITIQAAPAEALL